MKDQQYLCYYKLEVSTVVMRHLPTTITETTFNNVEQFGKFDANHC